MVLDINGDTVSGKEDPPCDLGTSNCRSVAESSEDSNNGNADDEPTRRSGRKRKLTTIKIGNYTVLAQDMNDSEESESSEVVTMKKPSKSKSATKSSSTSKKTDKPPKKKTKKDQVSSTKVPDGRCVSDVIPPEILERFFHESGNSSKTKEVTLKKQVLHGSVFDNTENFCAKIVTPIVQQPQFISQYKLYFVVHFDGQKEMMYLTPLFRNGLVKTTGMNKYCVNVIPKTGPVTADTCWQAMNVIHVPCSEWRIVHSRAISKTPDVRCERWEILEPEFDRMYIPKFEKPKSLKGTSIKRDLGSLYSTSEDQDDENEGSVASSNTQDEQTDTIRYHDVDDDTVNTKESASNYRDVGDTKIMAEMEDKVNSESKYNHDLVKDEDNTDKKESIESSGDVIASPSPPMHNQLSQLLDSSQYKSPSHQPTSSNHRLNNDEGEKAKHDLKSPDGVAVSEGQTQNLSEDNRICESPMAHERLGGLGNEGSEGRDDEEHMLLKDISFDQGFEALVAFKETYNHVSVPFNYSEVPWLSAWCNKKRAEYKSYQNDNFQDESAITENQISKLRNIGFNFHDSANQTFDEKLNELKEFKRIYGHDWFEHWRDKIRADAKRRKGLGTSKKMRKKLKPVPNTSNAFNHASYGSGLVNSQQSNLVNLTCSQNARTESSNALIESITKDHIQRIVPVPLGALGINVAVGTDKQLYISRILPKSPILDQVKERDIITHFNGEELNGDPVLFVNRLMNTVIGVGFLTILRKVNSTTLSTDMVVTSSKSDTTLPAEGAKTFEKDLYLEKKSETLSESEFKDLESPEGGVKPLQHAILDDMGTR
jgi:hypothetical protein